MRYRIMVVDDDEGVRRILRATLRPHYEVVEASDGLEAMQKLETHQPDIVIIDLMMPVIDGLELCRGIRRHPEFGGVPVIFLSASESRDQIKQTYAAGASLFLIKPIEPGRTLRNLEVTIQTEKPPIRPKTQTIEALELMDQSAAAESADANAGLPRIAPAAAPTAPAESIAHGKARVMIVDDDEDMLSLLDLTLQDHFEVVMARDGLEAVEKIIAYQPDILLVDVMMPKMNGFQLVQALRRNGRFADLPIFVVTAKASERDRQYALKIGATDFVAKPFSPDALLGRVRAVAAQPAFRIKAKRTKIEEIIEKEYLENKDNDDAKSQKHRKHLYAELENIINKESRKQGGGG